MKWTRIAAVILMLATVGLARGQSIPNSASGPVSHSSPYAANSSANGSSVASFPSPYASAASASNPPVQPPEGRLPATLESTPPAFDGSCGTCGNHAIADTEPWSPGRFWVSADYLLWWIRNEHPTAAVIGTAPANLAGLGVFPTGSITHTIGGDGGADLAYTDHSGVRVSAGFWFDSCRTLGLEASYFNLQRKTVGGTQSSTGDPILGPAFFDPAQALEIIVLNADPRGRTGTVSFAGDEHLWGADLNVVFKTCSFFSARADLLVGLRTLQFDEGLEILGTSIVNPGHLGAGNSDAEFDSFGTHNRFYGGQIGLATDYRWCRWFATLAAKVALGDMNENAKINGYTIIHVLGQPDQVFPGGIYSQPTNIGHYSRETFAVVPEFNANVGYQITSFCRVFIGYTFLYTNTVLRAGGIIDPNVNATQIQSLTSFNAAAQATHPVFTFHDTDFWAQGLNFGVEFRF